VAKRSLFASQTRLPVQHSIRASDREKCPAQGDGASRSNQITPTEADGWLSGASSGFVFCFVKKVERGIAFALPAQLFARHGAFDADKARIDRFGGGQPACVAPPR
jgi:hypothetical protein